MWPFSRVAPTADQLQLIKAELKAELKAEILAELKADMVEDITTAVNVNTVPAEEKSRQQNQVDDKRTVSLTSIVGVCCALHSQWRLPKCPSSHVTYVKPKHKTNVRRVCVSALSRSAEWRG